MTANSARQPRGIQPERLDGRAQVSVASYPCQMTNVENSRSIIDYNPKSGVRIIDASAGAAKKLGFYEQGLARVNSSSTC
jgi:hypothetical protein